jgi:hypothetical protein
MNNRRRRRRRRCGTMALLPPHTGRPEPSGHRHRIRFGPKVRNEGFSVQYVGRRISLAPEGNQIVGRRRRRSRHGSAHSTVQSYRKSFVFCATGVHMKDRVQ